MKDNAPCHLNKVIWLKKKKKNGRHLRSKTYKQAERQTEESDTIFYHEFTLQC